ncbi:protein SON isoform X2 [Synchiropus splendidus]|uniref:protein SON isoform X2 n=1 Tax=Synchiropus splendidus TaxID=270530 RepID=UPI00237ECB7A|nr:protein SON isoform X2 [Synchiropus splendidus]
MAANLEEIFQDFILNKIREIADQKDVKDSDGTGAARQEKSTTQKPTRSEKDVSKRRESPTKHKKLKKHKSKKKKKRSKDHDRRESSSECSKEPDSKRRPPAADKDDGKDSSSSKKKKKKKKHRKDGSKRRASDSDTECLVKQEKRKHSEPSSPKRRLEELPDIIPKQDSFSLGKAEDVDGHDPCCPGARSHSHSRSHSTTGEGRKTSHSVSKHSCQTPRSHSSRKNESSDRSTCSTLKNNSSEVSSQPEGNTSAVDTSTGMQQQGTATYPVSETTSVSTKSPDKVRKRKSSRSPHRTKDEVIRHKRSRSPLKSSRIKSRSRSRSRKGRSHSGGRRSRESRSSSGSMRVRREAYYKRDRWKREPSHSPVLILRKDRSPSRKHSSSASNAHRVSDLDKEQLLEIAKANAAIMCVKAGMPVPVSLHTSAMPLSFPNMAVSAAMASMTAASMTAALANMSSLSSLLPLPTITNKPPVSQANTAALEEVKRKVAKQFNSISIKEFTEKCQMIVDSKGELPVTLPHVSDEEENGKPFGASALREHKAISFNINNTTIHPGGRSDAGMAKEFPVSSGSQHRKKEGETAGAFGEWFPVEKAKAETPAAASAKKSPSATHGSSTSKTTAVGQSASVLANDSVFPEPLSQPIDISQAMTERIEAQRRLAENPYDVNAMCMLSHAQEQVDAWAQSNTIPGLFTGSTGAQVLSSEELNNGGPQAWLKKDQFLRAAPVSGGVGEFLMRKMGWRTGEGLGRNREGTTEPIIIDFKVDRKGLVAEGEKPQRQTGGLVVTKDLMGKHPVSALIEMCSKRRIMQPDFVMVHHSGPDHRKNFMFKVTVNGVDYQPQTASPNKKHAKAMAATVALQALGEVPSDGPGLYTGPVFTAASTGPLFST